MHVMRLGEKRPASMRVFVKIRKPDRISFESRESSSDGSVSGFLGNSQAVTMVVREEINAPASSTRGGGSSTPREHDARHERVTADTTRTLGLMTTLTSPPAAA